MCSQVFGVLYSLQCSVFISVVSVGTPKTPNNDTYRTRRSTNPSPCRATNDNPSVCIPWIVSWTYNNSVAFTVPPNTTTSVSIPIKTLKGFRNQVSTTGGDWLGHWWYLTGHPVRQDWDMLVTTEQSNYWTPGTSPEAKFFKDKVKLTHHGNHLKMTITLPDGHVQPPNATLFNTSCWGLTLWAWSQGADPYFPVIVCVNQSMEKTAQPKTNNYTQQAGITVISIPFEDVDGWFQVLTGVSADVNNWFLMIEQAANMTKKDFLSATSLMAFQNRPAVDMLLAEKGGVCAMFGEQCCTFIPNNTASDGSLTLAIEGLRTLNGKMKEHSGVDTSMWDDWMNVFGKYKALVTSIFISVAVFAAILTLCGCCCISCLLSLLNRLITTAISPMEDRMAQLYPLIDKRDVTTSDTEEESSEYHWPDLFPDPGDYE